MTPSLATPSNARPTRAQLLAAFRGEPLSTEALFNFCALPPDRLALIKDVAQPEDWSTKDIVLLKYLAVHVPMAIAQGRYVWNLEQIVLRAGHLATADGAAIYLGFARVDGDRWALDWASERPSTVEPLVPAELGSWPELDPRREVVIGMDQFRVPELDGLALATQNSAVAGAVEWSLRRGLSFRQLRGESRGHFAPFTSRTGKDGLNS